MKKAIALFFAISCMTIAVGCTNNTENNSGGNDAAGISQETASQDTAGQENVSQKTASQETTSQETASQETTSQDTASQNSISQSVQQLNQKSESSSEYIGEEAAKAVALEHAVMTETEVTYIKAKLDYDDGRQVYDIEFYSGNMEYDYEIDAYTGEITSYDFDIESYVITSPGSISSSNETYIGLDEAKVIALSKANLTEDQVIYIEAYDEYEDGITVYQIGFIANDMEYEFEINAVSGVIMEYDVESQFD